MNRTYGKHAKSTSDFDKKKSTSAYKAAALALVCLPLFTASIDKGVMYLYADWEPVPATCLLVGMYACFRLFLSCIPSRLPTLTKILLGVVSAVFAVFTVSGRCYDTKDISQSFLSLFSHSVHNKVVLACLLVGAFSLFHVFLCSLGGLYKNACAWWERMAVANRIERLLFGRHAPLRQMLLLLLCWVPQLLIRFPGYATVDAFHSLAQYQGQIAFSTKHPLIYTLVFGHFVDLGVAMGHPNYGLFLFVALQTLVTAGVIVYTLGTLKALDVPCWLRAITLLVFTFSPIVFSLASTAIKDLPFILGFMLVLDETAWFLYGREGRSRLARHLVIFAIGMALLFFRNNGTYTAYLLCLLFVLRVAFVSIRQRHIDVAGVAVVLTLALTTCAGQVINSHLVASLGAQQVTTRVLYSSTIQQIGRYLNQYPDDVSTAEMQKIQKVMDVSKQDYAKKYDPLKFDSVKGYFNQDATADELKDFLATWLALGQRHPDVYLASIMHQNYLMFSPLKADVKFYKRISDVWKKSNAEYAYDFSDVFSEKKALVPLQDGLRKMYGSISKFPVIGLFSSVGLANLVFFGLIAYALVLKRFDWLMLALPCFLTIGITFFGPAFSGNARYLYPLLWSMPLLVGSLVTAASQGRTISHEPRQT
ncbi:MAG: hypothetical protein J6S63_06495 [Atopobiaceae bacterium]|nr:hypothetical protein [Atopobiaceae bacterium]